MTLTEHQAMTKILSILAQAKKPLNKYELGKSVNEISKLRLYRNIDMFETWGLVQVAKTTKARAPGRISKHYRISKIGLKWLGLFSRRQTKATGESRYLSAIHSIITTIRPNEQWILTLKRDSLGRLSLRGKLVDKALKSRQPLS